MKYFLISLFVTIFPISHSLPPNTNKLDPKTKITVDQKLRIKQLKQQYAAYRLYKQEYNKRDEDADLEYRRFTTYLKNIEKIRQHNEYYKRGEETFEMGINQFTDMLPEELNKLNGYRSDMESMFGAESVLNVTVHESLPQKLDWRLRGAVTAVKDQGECGSCWTFSATGALEGQHFMQTGKLISLSEQNLLDCSGESYGNFGCDGGHPLKAYQYVIDNDGIDTEVSYPYEEEVGECRYQKKTCGTTCIRSFIVAKNDERKLQAAVAKYGPISVAVDAKSLHFYKKGIFGPKTCKKSPNHAVLVVGYGSEWAKGKRTDYWIIKNSWGKSWGENGYFRLARNQNNMCGIVTVPNLPVVQKPKNA